MTLPLWLICAALALLLLQAIAFAFGAWCVYVLVVNLLRRNDAWEMGVWGGVAAGEDLGKRRGLGPEGLPYLIGLSKHQPPKRRTMDR